MGAQLGRTITDYRALVETCRARAVELALSRSEIDRIGGLASGYSGKLLGKASVEDVAYSRKKSSKKMWPVALEAMLGVLGLKILLIEDDEATARTLALRIPVNSRQQRFGNKCHSKPQLAHESRNGEITAPLPKSAPVSRAHLRVVQTKRRASKYG